MITGEDIDRLYGESNQDRIYEYDTAPTAQKAEQMMKFFNSLRATKLAKAFKIMEKLK